MRVLVLLYNNMREYSYSHCIEGKKCLASFVGCGLWVVGCGLWVVGCGLWVGHWELGLGHRQSPSPSVIHTRHPIPSNNQNNNSSKASVSGKLCSLSRRTTDKPELKEHISLLLFFPMACSCGIISILMCMVPSFSGRGKFASAVIAALPSTDTCLTSEKPSCGMKLVWLLKNNENH